MRTLVAVAHTGSVVKTAETRGTTQSAVSRVIAVLEKIIDVPLIERASHGRRGVKTTLLGNIGAQRARTILLEIKDAERTVEELRSFLKRFEAEKNE